MMAPSHILHNNHRPMPLTLGVGDVVGDVPSSQPKVHVIAKTCDPRIDLVVTRGEVHEARWIIRDFIRCFAFSLKELG